MKIESKKASLSSEVSSVYQYLSNFENFAELLPQERVTVKESSPDHLVFEIKGMATIGMKVKNRKENEQVEVASSGKNPFDFSMDIYTQAKGDSESEAFVIFEGDVNPFLKMMVEKPLTNFFNSIAEELEKKEL